MNINQINERINVLEKKAKGNLTEVERQDILAEIEQLTKSAYISGGKSIIGGIFKALFWTALLLVMWYFIFS